MHTIRTPLNEKITSVEKVSTLQYRRCMKKRANNSTVKISDESVRLLNELCRRAHNESQGRVILYALQMLEREMDESGEIRVSTLPKRGAV